MRRVRAPLFPTVSPQNLNGLLTTYPLTTRQSIDGFREYGNAINDTHAALYFGGGQNELVNGNFFLNQRLLGSLGSGTGVRRMVDAWSLQSVGTTYTAAATAFTLGQTEVPYEPRIYHRMVVTSVAGAANFCLMYAAFQGRSTDYAQRRVSVTWWARADAAKPMTIELWRNFGTGGAPSAQESLGNTKVQLTAVWQKYQAFFDVQSLAGKTIGTDENDTTGIRFWFDAGANFNSQSGNLGQQSGTFDVAEVVANIGDFEIIKHRPYAQELLLSQRTFFRAGGTEPYQNFGSGLATATTTAFVAFALPVPMRQTPTLTVNNVANFMVVDSAGATTAPSAIATSPPPSRNNTTALLSVTAVGLTIGAVILSANNSTAATLDFSAEV